MASGVVGPNVERGRVGARPAAWPPAMVWVPALLVGAAVAMSGALSAALPAVARTPDPLDDLPRMSTPDARDFEAAAELLPEGLVEAVERDLLARGLYA